MSRYLTFEDYDHSPEPHQIKAIYDSGFPGLRPEFFQSFGQPSTLPTFYDEFPRAIDAGKGRVSMPYAPVMVMEPEFGRYESQTTGDCTLADSLVLLWNGSLSPIRDVRVGESVISGDGVIRAVTAEIKKRYSGRHLLRITCKKKNPDIKVDVSKIVLTPDHKVRVYTGDLPTDWKWAPAGGLSRGNLLQFLDTTPLSGGVESNYEFHEIVDIEAFAYCGNVYCLEVEADHSFVANGFVIQNCVSHGIRNAGMLDYCCDAYFGETKYEGRLATENIYGMRGHGGQGADPTRLSVYVGPEGSGGYLVRKRYEDGGNSVDLTRYNSSIGHNWGPRGTPAWVNAIATKNKALRVFRARTKEEARDALACGFGIGAASNYGFSSTRNQDGLSEQQGNWAHKMCWCGYDDSDYAHQKYSGGIPLMVNSWGLWIRGPKRFEQPDGSFFIRPKVADSYARQGGLYCFANVRGHDRELVYETMSKIAELSVG